MWWPYASFIQSITYRSGTNSPKTRNTSSYQSSEYNLNAHIVCRNKFCLVLLNGVSFHYNFTKPNSMTHVFFIDYNFELRRYVCVCVCV